MLGSQCKIENKQVAFPVGPDGKYSALWGHALNTKEAFFSNKPDRHPSSKGLPKGHIPLNNYLAVPALIGNTVFGLIALANSERPYAEQDIEAIKRLAEVYALALHRNHYELDSVFFIELNLLISESV